MKTFTVNGKTYKGKAFDINMICDFEEEGIPLEDYDKKLFSALRLYLSYCSKLNKAEAGKELELHLGNGGSVKELAEIFQNALQESNFFLSSQKEAEKNAAEGEGEATE